MSNYPFDLLVFICRAQPPHFGHLHVVMQALTQARKVLVLLGSSNSSRSLRNPFTYAERRNLFLVGLKDYTKNWMDDAYSERVNIQPLNDFTYNDTKWIAEVQRRAALYIVHPDKIGLIGFGKDSTSFYLKKFPFWKSIGVSGQYHASKSSKKVLLSSTDIRNALFDPNQLHGWDYLTDYMPEAAIQEMKLLQQGSSCAFRDRSTWDIMREEVSFAQEYRRGYGGTPHPVKFVTVDSVVIQAGHVLMIERGGSPGRGLMALPGGFLDSGKLRDESLRELTEETGLKVPPKVLRGSIIAHREFDDPYRSIRGRTITHTYLYKLDDEYRMPAVKGSSDAKRAFWQPLGTLDPTHCYEDHYHQIQTMVGMLPE